MRAFCYQCGYFITSLGIFLPALALFYRHENFVTSVILLPLRVSCYQWGHFFTCMKILLPVWVFCYECGYLETKCDVGQKCHGQNCRINHPNFLRKRASFSCSTVSLRFQEIRKRTQGTTTTRCATDHKSAVLIVSLLPLSQRTTRPRIQLTYLPSERNVTETAHIIGY